MRSAHAPSAAWDGVELPLLTAEELRLLSIRKGSLDQHERDEVESHVMHTYNFLRQIPWTRENRHIPEIARGTIMSAQRQGLSCSYQGR